MALFSGSLPKAALPDAPGSHFSRLAVGRCDRVEGGTGRLLVIQRAAVSPSVTGCQLTGVTGCQLTGVTGGAAVRCASGAGPTLRGRSAGRCWAAPPPVSRPGPGVGQVAAGPAGAARADTDCTPGPPGRAAPHKQIVPRRVEPLAARVRHHPARHRTARNGIRNGITRHTVWNGIRDTARIAWIGVTRYGITAGSETGGLVRLKQT